MASFKPLTVTYGSASVKIYRQASKSAVDGWIYVPTWRKPEGGRGKLYFADLERARDEAFLKAKQLAGGIAAAEHVTQADVQELAAARALARAAGIPLIPAMEEYVKARELAGGSILPACREFAQSTVAEVKRIKLSAAIEAFIATKDRAGKKGSRTYRAKLKPLLQVQDVAENRPIIGDVYVDTIQARQFAAYLETFANGVTRNDHRKRTVTLFRWLQKQGYLRTGEKLAIEATERAAEEPSEIGIISPRTYSEILEFVRKEHPEYLAATVLAGFCGVRSDEIHGKRSDKGVPRDSMKRQLWSDIWMDERKAMRVTIAKRNTQAWRNIPLADGKCDAALAWLQLIPESERKGFVCSAGAMERVRQLCIAEGFELPENCFRHSYITYTIAVYENKELAASRAGNRVAEIDRCYRVPMLKSTGVEWFAIRPAPAR